MVSYDTPFFSHFCATSTWVNIFSCMITPFQKSHKGKIYIWKLVLFATNLLINPSMKSRHKQVSDCHSERSMGLLGFNRDIYQSMPCGCGKSFRRYSCNRIFEVIRSILPQLNDILYGAQYRTRESTRKVNRSTDEMRVQLTFKWQ